MSALPREAVAAYQPQARKKSPDAALLEQHAGLVKRIAYHLAARLPASVEIDDLVQAGSIGLLEAARNYTGDKGASFETYAGIRIRGAMLDELRRGDWAPRSLHRKAREVEAAIRKLEQETGREAKDADVAKRVGISLEIPIGQRQARGQLGAATSGRLQAELALAKLEEEIAVEVRNAATAIETAAGRVQAARAGLVAAETQLRAEQDRFSVGATTNFFVLTRQDDLATAQLAEIAALTDYRKALTEFARATGTLLRDRNIHIN